ncbi:hypothetical protein K470DRAFT_154550 [Piedraia hortae CBS 480.64]|uniref:Uncharacterized protein n=1 Tax=Piedraia hortae CBS 480.64 TaxID=1314780 RepID=A0A6A7C7K3_9PEZI|nr:hypothetical protein K470DRAFT_154550 [Piedraia hortae CBS 480.64]
MDKLVDGSDWNRGNAMGRENTGSRAGVFKLRLLLTRPHSSGGQVHAYMRDAARIPHLRRRHIPVRAGQGQQSHGLVNGIFFSPTRLLRGHMKISRRLVLFIARSQTKYHVYQRRQRPPPIPSTSLFTVEPATPPPTPEARPKQIFRWLCPIPRYKLTTVTICNDLRLLLLLFRVDILGILLSNSINSNIGNNVSPTALPQPKSWRSHPFLSSKLEEATRTATTLISTIRLVLLRLLPPGQARLAERRLRTSRTIRRRRTSLQLTASTSPQPRSLRPPTSCTSSSRPPSAPPWLTEP